MTLSVFQDVLEFHRKMRQPVNSGFIPATLDRRRRIMLAEWEEMLEAVEELEGASVDAIGQSLDAYKKHVAQELVDVLYVVLGTFVELGIDPTAVWNAVQQANMQKEPNPDPNGLKALKPIGWKKPHIELVSINEPA